MFVPGRTTAIPGFNGGPDLEIGRVGTSMRTLLSHQLETLLPEAPEVEHVVIRGVPRLDDLALPYWTAP